MIKDLNKHSYMFEDVWKNNEKRYTLETKVMCPRHDVTPEVKGKDSHMLDDVLAGVLGPT